MNTKIERLERAKKLQEMELRLKAFKKLRFIKDDKCIYMYRPRDEEPQKISYLDYEIMIADIIATRSAVRGHYLYPWKKLIVI